ncbi:MAG TPA: hypothetical protein VHC22_24830 [Pirellulales bacterium]|nr:hypothetical protein [Pirellulales bacterium]
MPRPQFTLRALLVVVLMVGVACWLNRDVPVFAGIASGGALLLFVGDCCLQFSRNSKGIRFAVFVASGAVSLGLGGWFLGFSILTVVARRTTFD